MSNVLRASSALLVGTAFLLFASAGVRAAEVKVLAVAALAGAFKDIIPRFEQASGHKVVVQYQATPALMKMIESNEYFDLAVLVSTSLSDPAKNSYFSGPKTDLSRVGLGVAVRAGAPKPDLASTASFKQALLNAKSVAILPQSLNGQHFISVFERLGISTEMKGKIKPQSRPEDVSKAVADGDAEVGLFVANLLISMPGVDYAGPVPNEFQQVLVFTGAVGAKAKEPLAAGALLTHLASPQSAATMRLHGMDAP